MAHFGDLAVFCHSKITLIDSSTLAVNLHASVIAAGGTPETKLGRKLIASSPAVDRRNGSVANRMGR
jgi:hypothetical protein